MGVNKRKMIRLAEQLVKPEIERIIAAKLSNDDLQEEIINLTMALGFGMAVLATTVYTMDPDEFGTHMGEYITSTMKQLLKGGLGYAADKEKGSAWG